MKTVSFSAAILASGLAAAAVPVDGWYASVFGGYTYIPDNISTSRYGLTRTNASYNSGYHAGGRFGYQSTPLRYEGEITYLNAELKKFSINKIRQWNTGGQTSATVAMANVYYDFPEIVPAIAPFLGAGIGYARVDATLRSETPYGRTYLSTAGNAFAYQGTAGITYNFAENYAVNLAYRYIGTTNVSELGKVTQANLATFGAIYRFDVANYK